MLKLKTVMDKERRREFAKECLEQDMSIYTSEHLDKIDYLKDWIVDAMLEYTDLENNGFLDCVTKRNWFQRQRIEYRYLMYMGTGILIGLMLPYVC